MSRAVAVNTIRARHFGQLALRRNLDKALRDAKMTRAFAAREAGVKYGHLVGALAGDVWLTREAASDLAEMLAVSRDDLVGDSIFKDEVDRYADFQGRPHAQQWEVGEEHDGMPQEEVPLNRSRALCCGCGRLRLWDGKWDPRSVLDLEPDRRMLTELTCATCDQLTWHAIMRDHNEEHRDCAERDMYPTPQGAEESRALQKQIDLVTTFNVDVHWSNSYLDADDREEGYCVVSLWDRAKSRWRVELEPSAPPAVLDAALTNAWTRIARGEKVHRYMFRDTGAWGRTADNVISDFQVYEAAERRRMINHHVRQALKARPPEAGS